MLIFTTFIESYPSCSKNERPSCIRIVCVIKFEGSFPEITDLANRQVGELSGGQQQRVMLARTLAHDADLMLLDEPLNHVDITTQELIFHTLERLTARGKAVIVSTHDLGVLTVHFTRALFLDKRIIADGPPKEVLIPETIAEAYGFEFHKDYHPWNSSSNH